MRSLARLSLLIAFFICSYGIYSQTVLPSGTISSDSTWDISGSPYQLTGDITLASGFTLTIEQGVVVEFSQPSYDLIINGTLQAVGNVTDSIFFIGSSPSASVHGGSVVITDQSTGSQLDFASFKKMGDGSSPYDASLYIQSTNIVIGNVKVYDSEQSGIRLLSGASPTFNTAPVLIDQAFYGVRIDDGSPIIDNWIIDNTTNGIYLLTGDPQVSNTQVLNSGTNGIWLDGATSASFSDNIIDNAPVGLLIDFRNTPILTNNTFSNCTQQVITPADRLDKINFDGNGLSEIYLANGISIAENTTFEVSPWDVIMNGDVVVDAGVTLSIDPGFELFFPNSSYDLIVNGTIQAVGTQTDSIFFIGNNVSPSVHGGSLILGALSTGSVLDFISIRKMSDGGSAFDAGLYSESSSATISNLKIQDSEQSGVRLASGASPTFTSNTIHIDGGVYGFRIDEGSPIIDGAFIENVTNGVYIFEGNPLISNAQINNSSSYGVWIDGATNATLDNNTIDGASVGLYIDFRTVPTLTNNSFLNCTKQVVVPTDQLDKINFDGNGISAIYPANAFNVTVNTTLDPNPWDIILDADLIVDAGVTLTLNPGFTLNFTTASTDLFVNGTLLANGNATDSVFFVGSNVSEGVHGGSVAITATSTGSQLNYVSFRKMGDASGIYDAGLALFNSDVTVGNARFVDMEQAAIRIYDGVSPAFSPGNVEIYATTYGFRIDDGSPILDGMLIENSNNGIYVLAGDPIITNSQILNSLANGIWIDGATNANFSSNTIDGAGVGILIDFNTTPLLSNNSFLNCTKQIVMPAEQVDKVALDNNGFNEVYLANGFNVTSNTTFEVKPWNYIMDGDVTVDAGVNLTINPGVVVEFPSVSLDLIIAGTITALGTETDSIFFIGSAESASTHGGTIYLTSESTGSQFDYVSIRKMGDNSNPTDASVQLETSDVVMSNVKISDSEISGIKIIGEAAPTLNGANVEISSAETGLWILNGSPIIENILIEDNSTGILLSQGELQLSNVVLDNSSVYAIRIQGDSTSQILTNNISNSGTGIFIDTRTPQVITDNVITDCTQEILVPADIIDDIDFSSNNPTNLSIASGYNITSDVLFESLGYPYTLTGDLIVDNGFTLTVSPGVTLEFPATSYDLSINGTLIANGTESDSIFFIGTNPIGSNHGGNIIFSDVSSGSSIQYASIIKMGDGSSVFDAAISVSTNDVQLQHIRIDDSETAGLQFLNSVTNSASDLYITNSNFGIQANPASPSILNSRLEQNNYGAYINDGSPSIQYGSISGNTTAGVTNLGGGTVDARNNFWGDPSGPTNVGNPNGIGDEVTGTVLFEPFTSSLNQFALEFDGVDDYAEVPDAPSLDVTGAITLETWIRFDEAISEETPLIAKWNPDALPDPQRSYSLFLNNGAVWMAVSATGLTDTEGTDFSFLNVPYDFEVGKWYHIAGTFQPSTAIEIFVNGKMIGSKSALMVAGIFPGTATLNFGSNSNTVEVGVGFVSTGAAMTMDEARIWSEAKSEESLQSTMFGKLTGSESNLAAYYDFDEASGTVIADGTPNANDGLLFDNNNGTPDGFANGPIWGGSGAFKPFIFQPTATSVNGFLHSWIGIPNATTSIVEISQFSDFSSQVEESPYVLSNTNGNSESVSLSLQDSTILYLRMKYSSGEFVSSYSDTIQFLVTPGYALDFDGTDDYVRVAANSNLEPASAFTLESWVKIPTQPAVDQGVIFVQKGQLDTSPNGYLLGYVNNGGVTQVYLAFADQVPAPVVFTPNFEIPLDTWTHVAGTYDGANLEVFVNGTSIGTQPATGLLNHTGTENDLKIGVSESSGPVLDSYLQGQLDEVRIWGISKTEAEIQESLFNTLSGSETGLLGYYRFDQSTGTALPDLSLFKSNGIWTGPSGTNTSPNWVFSEALQSGTPPNAPQNLVVLTVSDTEVQLHWADSSNNENGFIIERSNNFTFSSPVTIDSVTANSTSYLFTAGNNQEYFYRVSSFNESGVTSSEVEFGTTEGFPGYSLDFDGIDDYLDAGNDPVLYGHQDLTFEVWIKPDFTNITDQGVIFSTLEAMSLGGGYQMMLNDLGTLTVLFRDNSFTDVEISSTAPLNAGEWYHVAGVIENVGSSESNMYLYLNGVLDNSILPTSGVPDYTDASNLFIGTNEDGVAGGALDREFQGELDELKIYSRVKTNFDDRQERPDLNDPDLIVYHSFDENAGTTVVDKSANLNNGVFSGDPQWTEVNIPLTYVVSNTNDSGPGSLRQVFNDAIASSVDTVFISFDLPSANDTIYVLSELPLLTGKTYIVDATTTSDWDFATGLMPTLKASDCSGCNGIIFDGNVELYGLRIADFDGDAIAAGIFGNDLVLGAPGKGNVIVNNGGAVNKYVGTNVIIQSNYIGVEVDGTPAGNNAGIRFTNGSSPLVGGLGAGEGNVISGTNGNAISVNLTGNLQVYGNYIGTDPTGVFAIPNSNGVFTGSVSGNHNIIGNIIAGNTGAGIFFQGNSNDTIQSNRIGININGDPLGNDGNGITFGGTSNNNLVGGIPSEGNEIGYNGGFGINLPGGASIDNYYLNNSFTGNVSGAINNASGANGDIQPPVIQNAISSEVSGTSAGDEDITLYLTNDDRQGAILLDSIQASGGSWTITDLSLTVGDNLVALATDTSGTSEFSEEFFFYPMPLAPGSAIDFDGSGSSEYAEILDDPTLDFGDHDFTVEYWVRKDATSSGFFNIYGVSKWNNAAEPGTNEWNMNIGSSSNSDIPVFTIESSNTLYQVASSEPVPIGEWIHLAGVREGDQMRIYLNGDLTGTTNNVFGPVNNLGLNVRIANNSVQNFYSDAAFDEVRIWRTAVDEATLQEYITKEIDLSHPYYPTLESYYKMDEGDGFTLIDIKGQNDATLFNSDPEDWELSQALFLPENDTTNKALDFDGVDDYVNVPDTPQLKIASTVTLTAWVKRDQLGSVDIILEKGGDWTAGTTNYGMAVHSVNNNMFYFFFDGGWRGTSGVQDLEWHHYAAVAQEGDADPLLYIDGVLQPIEFTDGAPTILLDEASNDDLHIGAQVDGGLTYYGDNEIDEVSIWSRLLTEEEIYDILSAGLVGSEPDLVTYYTFNQGIPNGNNLSETTLLSETSSDFDGTLNNFALSGTESNWIPAIDFVSLQEPTGFTALRDGFNIQFSWDDNSFGELNYIMEFSIDNQNWNTFVNLPKDSTQFYLAGLASNEAYFWRVGATSSDDTVYTESLYQGNVEGFGNALQFNGSNHYVELFPFSEDTLLNENGFSFEFWAKPLSASAGRQALVSLNVGTTSNFNKILVLLNSGNLSIIDNASGATFDFNGPFIVDGQFHHIAYTRSGSLGELYLDGNLVGSHVADFVIDPTDVWSIGQEFDGINSPTDFFEGEMDELRFWDYAIDSLQINMFKDSTLTGLEPGLVAYYRFDQLGSTTTLPDRTGSFNDGNWQGSGGPIWTPSDVADAIPDGLTLPPVLISPLFSSINTEDFDVEFILPEDPQPGSVSLTFTNTGGVSDLNSPHVITFNSNFENTNSNFTTLNFNDLSNDSNVAAVNTDPDDFLSDGGIYDVTLSYVDTAGNAAATFTAIDVLFTTQTIFDTTNIGGVDHITITDVGNGIGNVNFTNDNVYLLNGFVFVNPGQTLTIEAGTVIKGKVGPSMLVVSRDAQIIASGTAEQPIIFTSEVDNLLPPIDSTNVKGTSLTDDTYELWGGLVLLGRAPISASADSVQIEGIPFADTRGLYGGFNPGDNSGVLQYVSVRHGGINIGEGNNINGITLAGVGDGTTVENIEIFSTRDDGLELFGGTVNVANVIVFNTGDDGYDIDQAYGGIVDNYFMVAGNNTDHLLEIDGPEGALEASFVFRNGTLKAWPVDLVGGEIADFKSGARGLLENSYIFNFNSTADIELDDDETSSNYQGGDLQIINNQFTPPGAQTIADIVEDRAPSGNNALFESQMSAENSLVSLGTATVGADTTVFEGWTAYYGNAPDAIPPVVSVFPLITNNNSPQLNGSIDDPAADVTVIVDGGNYTAINNGSFWTLPAGTISPPLFDGVFDVQVEAEDIGGNIGVDGTVDELVIDTTPPEAYIQPEDTTDSTPQLLGSISEPLASILITVDGQTVPATTQGDTLWIVFDGQIGPLDTGTYDVQIQATDFAGNSLDTTYVSVLIIRQGEAELTLATIPVPGGPLTQGDQDQLIYAFSASISNGDAMEEGFYLTFGDTLVYNYLVDSAFFLYRNTVSNNFGAAVQIAGPSSFGDTLMVPPDGIGFPLSDSIRDGDTFYYYITADVEPDAPDSGFFQIQTPITEQFGFSGFLDKVDGGLTAGQAFAVIAQVVDTIPPIVSLDTIDTSDPSPEIFGFIDDFTADITVFLDSLSFTAVNNGNGTWFLPGGTLPNLDVGIYSLRIVAEDADGNVTDTTFVDILEILLPQGMVSFITLPVSNQVVAQGLEDVLFYKMRWDVSDTIVLVEGFYLNFEGTSVPEDFADSTFKLYYNSVDDFASATLFGASDYGDNVIIPDTSVGWFYQDTLIDGESIFFYTTVDIDAAATPGHEFNVSIPGDENFGVTDATKDLGGLVAGPSISIVASDNVAPVIDIDVLETLDNTPPLSGAIDDPDASITIQVNGIFYAATNNQDGTWNIPDDTIVFLNVGVYDVEASAIDPSGNEGTDDTNDELRILPAAVAALPATSITPLSFTANWEAGIDVQAYILEVAEDASFNQFVPGYDSLGTSLTSALVSGLDYTRPYFYRVRTLYFSGDISDYSNTISVSTSADPGTSLDSMALMDLYNATGGPDWTNNSGWGTDLVRNWFGVVQEGTRVTSVSLPGNNLQGEVPAISEGLENLTNLDLSGNEISSVGEIDILVALTTVNISANRLSFEDIERFLALTGNVNYTGQNEVLEEIRTLEQVGLNTQLTEQYEEATPIPGLKTELHWLRPDLHLYLALMTSAAMGYIMQRSQVQPLLTLP